MSDLNQTLPSVTHARYSINKRVTTSLNFARGKNTIIDAYNLGATVERPTATLTKDRMRIRKPKRKSSPKHNQDTTDR